MVYFNIFDIFKYILNSIRYRIVKHAKTFTILLIVFIVAFLFGTQSKAVNLPNFDTIVGNNYYFVYYDSWYGYCIVACPEEFNLRITTLNGQDYITAYNPRAFNLSHGYWDKNTGAFTWWDISNSQYLYLRKSNTFAVDNFYKYSNFDIHSWIGGDLIFPRTPYVEGPFISTDSATIEDWSFDTLTINGNSISPVQELEGYTYHKNMYLTFTYNNSNYYKEISSSYINEYLENEQYKFYIDIPKSFFNNSLYLVENANLDLTLSIQEDIDSNDITNYSLGSYNITISADVVEDTNNSSDKNIQDNIYNEQQKTNENLEDLKNQQQATTNSINNLNNSLIDSNVDDNNVNEIADLSNGFDVTDNTGIDQLFQMVYNAFCSNNPEDLVFTIPFTNTQVTINQNNISSRFPEAIKNIVGVFVWGFIGLYVLKDIRTMINKISEGSPEDVGSDVKKEVL